MYGKPNSEWRYLPVRSATVHNRSTNTPGGKRSLPQQMGSHHGLGGQSPTSHRGGLSSIPGQSVWNLWWTKWHYDRFLSQHFGFPLSVSFHQWSILIIMFVIPVTFVIKLDWSVCICLTQLYDGRDMYRIYYIKNNYIFRHFTLAIFRLRNKKT